MCHSAITTALEFANEESEQLTAEEFLTWLCEPQDDGSSPIGTSRLIKFAQDALADKKAGYPQSTLADQFSYGWLVEQAETNGIERISLRQLDRAADEFRAFLTDGHMISALGYAETSLKMAVEKEPGNDSDAWIDTATGNVISGE